MRPGDTLADAAVANIQLVVERATRSAPERLFAPGTVSHRLQTQLDGTNATPAPRAIHNPLA